MERRVEQMLLVRASGDDWIQLGEARLRTLGQVFDRPPEVQITHLVLESREQSFRDELVQNEVGSLEGGEDVGVRLERGEPVCREIALTTTRFAASL